MKGSTAPKRYAWEVCPLVGVLDDEKTVYTETGELSRTYRLEGKDYNGLHEGQVAALFVARAQLFAAMDENLCLQVHTHKHRVSQEIEADRFSLPHAGKLANVWNSQFTERFVTENFAVATVTDMGLLGGLANRVNDKKMTAAQKEKLLDSFELDMNSRLSDYQPSILSGNALPSYWSWMLNGDYLDLDVSGEAVFTDLLAGKELFFPRKGQAMRYGADKYSSFVYLKLPGKTASADVLESVLKLPQEVSIFQSFRPMSKATSLRILKDRRATIEKWATGNSIAFVEMRELESRIEADLITQLEHWVAIEVKADTLEQLDVARARVVSAVEAHQFRAAIESVNAEATFWGRFPSLQDLNPRQRIITNENAAHFVSLSRIGEGLESCSWGPHPVTYLRTEKGSTYGFTFHQSPAPQELGHVLAIGGSNAGKTTIISFLLSQCFKFDGFRAVLFDRLQGMEVFSRIMGGRYEAFAGTDPLFNPLQREDSQANRVFVNNFLEMLIGETDGDARRGIDSAVNALFTLEPRARSLKEVNTLLNVEGAYSATERLSRFIDGGVFGHYFNAKQDALAFDSPLAGFDMTQVLDSPEVLGPMAYYIFHAIMEEMKTHNGGFAVFVDEFPRYLKSAAFVPYVEVILQELRKLNGVGIFACQDAKTVFDNELVASKLQANIAGYLLFPDPQADAAYYQDIMGLTNKEMTWIRTPHSRQALFKRKSGETAILNVDLAPLGNLLRTFNSSADAVRQMNKLRGAGDGWIDTFLGN